MPLYSVIWDINNIIHEQRIMCINSQQYGLENELKRHTNSISPCQTLFQTVQQFCSKTGVIKRKILTVAGKNHDLEVQQ